MARGNTQPRTSSTKMTTCLCIDGICAVYEEQAHVSPRYLQTTEQSRLPSVSQSALENHPNQRVIRCATVTPQGWQPRATQLTSSAAPSSRLLIVHLSQTDQPQPRRFTNASPPQCLQQPQLNYLGAYAFPISLGSTSTTRTCADESPQYKVPSLAAAQQESQLASTASNTTNSSLLYVTHDASYKETAEQRRKSERNCNSMEHVSAVSKHRGDLSRTPKQVLAALALFAPHDWTSLEADAPNQTPKMLLCLAATFGSCSKEMRFSTRTWLTQCHNSVAGMSLLTLRTDQQSDAQSNGFAIQHPAAAASLSSCGRCSPRTQPRLTSCASSCSSGGTRRISN